MVPCSALWSHRQLTALKVTSSTAEPTDICCKRNIDMTSTSITPTSRPMTKPKVRLDIKQDIKTLHRLLEPNIVNACTPISLEARNDARKIYAFLRKEFFMLWHCDYKDEFAKITNWIAAKDSDFPSAVQHLMEEHLSHKEAFLVRDYNKSLESMLHSKVFRAMPPTSWRPYEHEHERAYHWSVTPQVTQIAVHAEDLHTSHIGDVCELFKLEREHWRHQFGMHVSFMRHASRLYQRILAASNTVAKRKLNVADEEGRLKKVLKKSTSTESATLLHNAIKEAKAVDEVNSLSDLPPNGKYCQCQ